MTDARPARGPMVRALAVVGLLYACAVVWLTWPLASRATTLLPRTQAPCEVDTLLMGVVLAHESRALLEHPLAFADAGFFHPDHRALLYGEAAFGALPLFIGPFLSTGNPTLSLNLLLLGGVTLTALALHGVVWRWTGTHPAGFVAGATFLSTRWVLWNWIPIAPNYAVLFYLPIIVLVAATPTPRRRASAAHCALVVLQGLVSVYYAIITLVPLGVIAAARLLRRATRADGARLAATLALAAAVLALAYVPYLRVRRENPDLASQTVWAMVGLPHEAPLALETFLPSKGPLGVPVATLVVVAAGLAARLARRAGTRATPSAAWCHAGLWTLAGIAMAAPPLLRVGSALVPLPHAFVWELVRGVARDNARLGAAGLVGLSLLAGLAFAECRAALGVGRVGRLATATAAAVLVGWMYGGYASGRPRPDSRPEGPMPPHYLLQAVPDPASPLMRLLAAPGGPLLELPINHLNRHTRAMYAAVYHRRPVLNGYNGYWPADFPRRMALACRLPDPAALAELRRETGLATILVHLRSWPYLDFFEQPPPYGCAPPNAPRPSPKAARRFAVETYGAWLRAMRGESPDLRLVARDDTNLLFEVVGPAPP